MKIKHYLKIAIIMITIHMNTYDKDTEQSYISIYEKIKNFSPFEYNEIDDKKQVISLIENECFDDVQMFDIIKKIVPRERLLKEILTYEFINNEQETKHKNIENILDLIKSEMKRYQNRIGGFGIEDINWIVCTKDTRIKTKENQYAIYNTISERYSREQEFTQFMDAFISHMKKFLEEDSNINISYKVIDDEYHSICWLVIVCENR
jgi:hypothetical protein